MCVTDLRKLIEPSREEFLFSGNERVRYSGINDYDFHARRYNAAIPRFDKQDIFNDLYLWVSPYSYCIGNPIRYTDHYGLYHNYWDALNDAANYGNAEVMFDYDRKEYFLALDPNGKDAYTTGDTLRKHFGESSSGSSSPVSSGLFVAGSYYGYRAATQYNTHLGIWRGNNDKIYYGLNGKGPNQHTGSRANAKAKYKKLNLASRGLTIASMAYVEYEYYMLNKDSLGPNMQRYLYDKRRRDQVFNGIGLANNPIALAISFGYNLGYQIEYVGQWATGNPDFRIRLNPYTLDFTPIEKTLQEYDEMGVEIY